MQARCTSRARAFLGTRSPSGRGGRRGPPEHDEDGQRLDEPVGEPEATARRGGSPSSGRTGGARCSRARGRSAPPRSARRPTITTKLSANCGACRAPSCDGVSPCSRPGWRSGSSATPRTVDPGEHGDGEPERRAPRLGACAARAGRAGRGAASKSTTPRTITNWTSDRRRRGSTCRAASFGGLPAVAREA